MCSSWHVGTCRGGGLARSNCSRSSVRGDARVRHCCACCCPATVFAHPVPLLPARARASAGAAEPGEEDESPDVWPFLLVTVILFLSMGFETVKGYIESQTPVCVCVCVCMCVYARGTSISLPHDLREDKRGCACASHTPITPHTCVRTRAHTPPAGGFRAHHRRLLLGAGDAGLYRRYCFRLDVQL